MRHLSLLLSTLFLLASVTLSLLLLLSGHSLWIEPDRLGLLSLLPLAFPILLILGALLALASLILRRWSAAAVMIISMAFCSGSIRSYLPLASPGSIPDDKETLSIISYNVQGFINEPAKSTEMADYLIKKDADLVLMQEFRYGSKSVEKLKTHYKHLKVTYEKQGGSHMQLALFSKHPILRTSSFDTGSQGNGACEYLIKSGSDTIYIMNCHLESNQLDPKDRERYEEVSNSREIDSVKAYLPAILEKVADSTRKRASQARAIQERVHMALDRGWKVIVAGDFNEPAQSYAHSLLSKDLIDAFTTSGRGLGYSFLQGNLRFRIDHILLGGGLHALRSEVDDSVRLSDHFPIFSIIASEQSK